MPRKVEAMPVRRAAPRGPLADVGDNLARQGVDLLVRHRALVRLQRHRDHDRFLAGLDSPALVDVERI